MKKPSEPLRGESAWLAAKADMRKRNDAARLRAEKEGAASEARAAARRQVLARQELTDLPSQPGPNAAAGGGRRAGGSSAD